MNRIYCAIGKIIEITQDMVTITSGGVAVTGTPIKALNDGDKASIEVEVKSTSPYKKTLKVFFQICEQFDKNKAILKKSKPLLTSNMKKSARLLQKICLHQLLNQRLM